MAIVTVEEYLSTSYKPACDYRDGVLARKSLPTWKHGSMQTRLGRLIGDRFPGFEPAAEVTMRIRQGKYLVPDLIAQDKSHIQDPYPLEPVHLCVEILSPSDKMSETLAKCEEYHEWGVEHTWIIDPEMQRAWEYRAGQRPHEVPPDGNLTAGPITLPWRDVFQN